MNMIGKPAVARPPNPLVLLAFGKVIRGRIDPELLETSRLVAPLHCFLDKLGSPLSIAHVGHGHPPVRHCAVRIECRYLPEGALCFEIPEAMKLSDTLVEELLGGGGLCRDRKVHVTGPRDQDGHLSRPFIECFSVGGVAKLSSLSRVCSRGLIVGANSGYEQCDRGQ